MTSVSIRENEVTINKCDIFVFDREYTSRFNSEDTLLFCMRVMVGVIILYDHVHPNGAFTKSSKIDVRPTICYALCLTVFDSRYFTLIWCMCVFCIDEGMHKGIERPTS